MHLNLFLLLLQVPFVKFVLLFGLMLLAWFFILKRFLELSQFRVQFGCYFLLIDLAVIIVLCQPQFFYHAIQKHSIGLFSTRIPFVFKRYFLELNCRLFGWFVENRSGFDLRQSSFAAFFILFMTINDVSLEFSHVKRILKIRLVESPALLAGL